MELESFCPEFDVAIVGYGPIGAAFANLLGQEGLKVAIFEREKSVYHMPRASHLDGESMRIIQAMNLGEELEEVMIGAKGYEYINSEGKLLLELKRSGDKGPQGWNQHYRFYQPDFEKVLRTGVKRFSNVHVFLFHDVIGVQESKDMATLKVENKTEEKVFNVTASYVIGCDGAKSLVREVMGTPLEDLGLHQPWLVVDAKLKQPVDMPKNGIQFCNPARPITYVPQIGDYDRYRWEIRVLPGEEKEEMERPEKVWDFLRPWITPENAEIERATVYIFHSLIARGWRKGRLLLAGDAAHMTPPFLGQGLCAGLRDAANLTWKLKMVIQDGANSSLLDTYETERYQHVKEYIKMAVELGKIIATLDPVESEKIHRKLLESPPSMEEPCPPLGEGLHGELPSPAGNLFLQPRMDDGSLLDDNLGYRFAVIGDPKVLEAVKEETKRRWESIGVVVVSDPGIEMNQWLKDQHLSAILLRPDRYLLGAASNSSELDVVSQHLPLEFSEVI
ncbi:bifunctional 3-(3-hydroxy-phenyl)propionate/3-hydroxycinnamic acid hydroxylase [Bacillus sp. OK048]|uniref:bifunctional 3-(3-hydroxy-phenyl)propionate/3-hydroxycinnamic acid hydroxylase MhpA n=1 Tax=Bacillus sp. OK048 TaxID=1882761 RepID=UPI0008912124|nr:bifunctional 3-(3-hydroxy-phenyl)propionate/3-hydroxycinnamic acid hydroxylase [Bacillus sp. OK048]SDM48049.1 3-(3-hydroxy-phenyl)propionate hydroxylase [Bacillus sp. OK048]